MKKRNIVFVSMLLCAATFSANAQSWSLTGNTGTNTNTHFIGTRDSRALVFRTNNKARMRIESYGGLRLIDPGVSTNNSQPHLLYGEKSSPGIGLHINNLSTTSGSAAIYGTTRGPGYAVVGVSSAGNGTEVIAGIYGESLYGSGVRGYSYNGYGVIASSSTYIGLVAIGAPNSYASYFVGNVFASGGYYAGSDQKLKQNVQDLNSAMEIINQLRPKKYHYRQEGNYKLMKLPQGTQYGLVAQDVEKIVPELVKDTKFETSVGVRPDAEGKADRQQNTKPETVDFKALNYMGLIPIMIKGMQEQQALILEQQEKINSQNEKIEQLTARVDQQAHPLRGKTGFLNSNDVSYHASLMQNAPNPFHQSTIIKYSVPQQASSAVITITDMHGTLLKTYAASAKDNGQLVIEGGQLAPGIYYYSLMVEGKLVDTKKMVLLK